MFHKASNVDTVKNFILKKIIFQNGPTAKIETPGQKCSVIDTKVAQGKWVWPRVGTCLLGGVWGHIGSHSYPHRSPYFSSLDCYCKWSQMVANGRKWSQMGANGRKWAQMGAKDIKLTVLLYLQALTYPIGMYFHIFLIVTCTRICWPLARIFDSQLDTMLHTYLIVTCTDIWYPLAHIFVDYLYAYLMVTYTHIC